MFSEVFMTLLVMTTISFNLILIYQLLFQSTRQSNHGCHCRRCWNLGCQRSILTLFRLSSITIYNYLSSWIAKISHVNFKQVTASALEILKPCSLPWMVKYSLLHRLLYCRRSDCYLSTFVPSPFRIHMEPTSLAKAHVILSGQFTLSCLNYMVDN